MCASFCLLRFNKQLHHYPPTHSSLFCVCVYSWLRDQCVTSAAEQRPGSSGSSAWQAADQRLIGHCAPLRNAAAVCEFIKARDEQWGRILDFQGGG